MSSMLISSFFKHKKTPIPILYRDESLVSRVATLVEEHDSSGFIVGNGVFISPGLSNHSCSTNQFKDGFPARFHRFSPDRKSTRLNSSHVAISYAVFCSKKKKK